MAMEDENHALYLCIAHREIRHQHKQLLEEYSTVKEMLHPRNTEDISRIAKYLVVIESNMDKLKMKR